MNRDQSRLAKLRPQNGEHPFLQIYVLCLQVAGLADTQPRNGQQPQQAVIGRSPQTVGRR